MFTLTINTVAVSYQHGFHLGTHEGVARFLAQDIYYRRSRDGDPIVSVDLKREGELVDTFNGEWVSGTDEIPGHN